MLDSTLVSWWGGWRGRLRHFISLCLLIFILDSTICIFKKFQIRSLGMILGEEYRVKLSLDSFRTPNWIPRFSERLGKRPISFHSEFHVLFPQSVTVVVSLHDCFAHALIHCGVQRLLHHLSKVASQLRHMNGLPPICNLNNYLSEVLVIPNSYTTPTQLKPLSDEPYTQLHKKTSTSKRTSTPLPNLNDWDCFAECRIYISASMCIAAYYSTILRSSSSTISAPSRPDSDIMHDINKGQESGWLMTEKLCPKQLAASERCNQSERLLCEIWHSQWAIAEVLKTINSRIDMAMSMFMSKPRSKMSPEARQLQWSCQPGKWHSRESQVEIKEKKKKITPPKESKSGKTEEQNKQNSTGNSTTRRLVEIYSSLLNVIQYVFVFFGRYHNR